MSFTLPTPADFKAQFYRDFPYGTGNDQTSVDIVRDADIQAALNMTGVNFNESFWGTQAVFTSMYCLLAAHYLVVNFQNSSVGLAGQTGWLTTHQNVDSVQQSFATPEWVMDNPELAAISKTRYGLQYISFIVPYLRGQMLVSYDPAHAGS